MSNPAHALAATGTPGPWTAHEGDLEGGTVIDYLATLVGNREADGTTTRRLFLTQAPNNIDPERGAMVVPCTTGDGPNSEANAVKLARAVSALGPLGDYDDAVMAYLKHQAECTHGPDCSTLDRLWRGLTAARDRLMAALTGDAT